MTVYANLFILDDSHPGQSANLSQEAARHSQQPPSLTAPHSERALRPVWNSLCTDGFRAGTWGFLGSRAPQSLLEPLSYLRSCFQGTAIRLSHIFYQSFFWEINRNHRDFFEKFSRAWEDFLDYKFARLKADWVSLAPFWALSLAGDKCLYWCSYLTYWAKYDRDGFAVESLCLYIN